MKKNSVKAFTLVEMLIVIVIIGILIAALLPRMQGAQGRARDVSRQTNLSQIATAIVSSQADKREWPKQDSGAEAMNVTGVTNELLKAGMSDVPSDPNGLNSVWGLGSIKSGNAVKGQYIYMVSKKNGANNAGFILMASTETEGASNWVVCGNADTSATELSGAGGYIATGTDLSDITICSQINEGTCKNNNDGSCTYANAEELRYIYTY